MKLDTTYFMRYDDMDFVTKNPDGSVILFYLGDILRLYPLNDSITIFDEDGDQIGFCDVSIDKFCDLQNLDDGEFRELRNKIMSGINEFQEGF